MTIYIASSWKNKHAVEMLTRYLRSDEHEVRSFVENNHGEDHVLGFEEWIESESAERSFFYDTNAAMGSDLVIYIGPSGVDAWAEVGAAYASNVPILGLQAKGEQVGLMRKMVVWFDDFFRLLNEVNARHHIQLRREDELKAKQHADREKAAAA